jgi:hypothetical protein
LPPSELVVLRQRDVAGVTGADVQQPVRPEGDPAAVVDGPLRDAGQHRLERARAVGRKRTIRLSRSAVT